MLHNKNAQTWSVVPLKLRRKRNPAECVRMHTKQTHFNNHKISLMSLPTWNRTDCSVNKIVGIMHPIHRFKSSDWLKEGHMTWNIFWQSSCLEINSCVLFLTKLNPCLTLWEAEQLPNWDLDSLLSRFIFLQILINWYKMDAQKSEAYLPLHEFGPYHLL